MKNSMNIVRKELDKIFRNPRLIFTTFILPGLIIFVIYSFMGSMATNESEKVLEQTTIIYVANQPDSFKAAVNAYNEMYDKDSEAYLNANFVEFDGIVDKELFKRKIENGEASAYLIFEKDFDKKVTDFINKEIEVTPIVEYYMDKTKNASSIAEQKITTLINIVRETYIQTMIGNTHIINTQSVELSTEDAQSRMMLGMLLPMFLMMFVFAGGLAVGSDAIAGEKERGTIATLLMTPIPRNQIVFGKIISTIIITILSAIGSFVGTVLSLKNAGALFGNISISGYQLVDYLQLLIVVILIALMAASLFLIASTISKNVKEATSYAMPFYILSMVIGMSSMFMDKMPTDLVRYAIPLYNLSIVIKGILIHDLPTGAFLVTTISTVLFFGVCLLLITKLFRSERLMFAK